MNIFILFSLLDDSFAGYKIYWLFSSSSALWKCHPLPSGLQLFIRNQLLILLGFNILNMLCLGVALFAFVLLGIYWGSWMYKLMFFITFGEFQTLFLWIFLSAPFSLPCPICTIIYMFVDTSYGILRFSETPFVFLHFLSLCFADHIIFIFNFLNFFFWKLKSTIELL